MNLIKEYKCIAEVFVTMMNEYKNDEVEIFGYSDELMQRLDDETDHLTKEWNRLIDKHNEKIRAEFAHELKETFNNETPSNYASTQPFFTLENVRALVDMTLKEQR